MNIWLNTDAVICQRCFGERFYDFHRSDTISVEEAIVGIHRGIGICSIDQLAAAEDNDLL